MPLFANSVCIVVAIAFTTVAFGPLFNSPGASAYLPDAGIRSDKPGVAHYCANGSPNQQQEYKDRQADTFVEDVGDFHHEKQEARDEEGVEEE